MMADRYTKIILTLLAISTSTLAIQGFYNDIKIELISSDKVQKITLCNQYGKDCGVGTYDRRPLIIDEEDNFRLYRMTPFKF